MDQDSKSTALKDVQGHIWEEGYATGELVGEVFDDVAPALRRWRARGLDIGIFSSGSALAQKLLFRHSSAGDLTPLLSWHFDTTVGPKTDPESYRRIASSIGVPLSGVLFISDVVPELDAARTAGMQTALWDQAGQPRRRRTAMVTPPSGHSRTSRCIRAPTVAACSRLVPAALA